MQTTKSSITVNNDLYDTLGERWYTASDDPVALLRAESKLHGPWITGILKKSKSAHGQRMASVLDVGCGGGFKSNYLAKQGFEVTGIDLSDESLAIAKKYDQTNTVKYMQANAEHLPFADQSFDAVIAMDFLEHVENPAAVISEISRVLKPSGVFFFHTFNRNWISWFVVIKCVEWLVKNTPPHMHILRLFIKPRELNAACIANDLVPMKLVGVMPRVLNWDVFKGIFSRSVPKSFSFKFIKSTVVAYSGYALKQAHVNL